ncbi:hypothetical protein EDC45_2053 [Mesocricetibacter intestinalis]|uniref:DUF535 domain-containing protein n=1 Tax=Mesocricetibacter intestinalis TaxID=1521930 RepID=A0A4R6V9N5_9PAST|nr:DUF535 family protein [Mesocricetibacter intestinalis]TDQ56142.1 hypothetical protein EDC45_2053 [Mesocricetibacter intestinalis]
MSNQNAQYQWPKAVKLYPDQGKKSYRSKRLRFYLRSALHFGQIKRFTRFINQHPEFIPLFERHADFSYPLAHRFLDKRFSAARRFEAICDNLCFLPEKIAALNLPPLWQHPICFGEVIEGFELYLNINRHQPMEGFWALELIQKESGRTVYLLTFGKVQNALLIGVIQGPNFEGSKELVKQLTKQCHGLRPAYFMVEAMKSLSIALGYDRLCGIPQKYQNKSRWVRAKRYIVDYDAIFAECAASLQDYWYLPLEIETKNLTEIPSNKRSKYRKRYAMLAELRQQISAALQ